MRGTNADDAILPPTTLVTIINTIANEALSKPPR